MVDKWFHAISALCYALPAAFYLAIVGWYWVRDRKSRTRQKEAMEDLDLYLRNPAQWKIKHGKNDHRPN